MSVKATTTVSIAPLSTVGPQLLEAQHARDPIPSGRTEDTPAHHGHPRSSVACLDNSLADAGEYATGSTASEATAGLFIDEGGGMSETPAPAPGAIHTSEDEQILHKMGYAQELFRAMGGFQNFAISFTIISILAGCLTSYFIAFNNGGPVAITWGWLIVGLMSTLVALAMAEIASAYPTAGGLYYWSSKLGSPAWGWFTGWFNLVGQIAVTAAIGYGLAIFLTSLLNLLVQLPEHEGVDLPHLLDRDARRRRAQHVQGQHHRDAEHDLGVLAHGRRRVHRRRADHRPGQPSVASATSSRRRSTTPASPGPASAASCSGTCSALGLLMSQYTITGFDASAHMAEETHQASRMAAVGMYMSVVVSVIFGWVLLLAVTFAVPDTQGALDAVGGAVTYIWTTSMSQTWAEILLFICCVAQMFCLTASVTSASRMMFAFSRDRAVPGHHAAGARSSATACPYNAVLAIGILAWALMIPTYWNDCDRLPRGHVDRGDRPLHRVHPAGDPAVPAGRQLRARRLEPREALQVDRPHLDRLGGPHLDPLPRPGRTGGDPVAGRLQLGRRELRAAHRRRRAAPLRRLVGHLGAGTGSRARCGWAPRKSSSSWRRRQEPGFAVPADTQFESS